MRLLCYLEILKYAFILNCIIWEGQASLMLLTQIDFEEFENLVEILVIEIFYETTWLDLKKKKIGKYWGKLHFTILNYTLDYTLHPILFECILCILNYHNYHTLHPYVTFTVKLDKNNIT